MTEYDDTDCSNIITWTRWILDLTNTTYLVSNGGKEIRFSSKLSNTKQLDVKLYPTTGTYRYLSNTFRAIDEHNTKSIENNIKKCLNYHIRDNIFNTVGVERIKYEKDVL